MANSPARLDQGTNHLWHFTRWASPRVEAGITDRNAQRPVLQSALRASFCVEAEQVHGSGLAVVDRMAVLTAPLPGCDGLLTAVEGVALFVRTADCLPIFFADASRGVIGLAHAGWRGLVKSLPMRMVAAMKHYFHSQAGAIQVAIGPAIRSCCYEVGPEFERFFKGFIRRTDTRCTCDLIGAAIEQLKRCGVSQRNIFDSQHCTACKTQDWFSLRREGPLTGRLTSFIMLRP